MYKAVSGIFCNFAPRNTAIPMRLKKLSLLHFKNIARQELEFCRGVNCLVGDNGAGKTNVMDAIYYLSSYSASV